MKKRFALAMCLAFVLMGFQSRDAEGKESAGVKAQRFGKLSDGREVTLYTLRNKNKATVAVTNLGAALVSITVPDRNGVQADVLLGYDDAQGYVDDNAFLGFLVGRYANRLSKGQFTLNGKQYQLTLNDGENQLHGGKGGFHRKLWKAKINERASAPSVTLRCVSADGEEGFPGNVTLDVTYTWNDSNQLIIEYSGTTDAPTVLNPTSHGYFNLTGNPNTTILDHEVMIAANEFTPVDRGLIPTGERRSVEGTPLDFRTPRKVGDRINESFEQLQLGKGYDHNWVLNAYDKSVRLVATVFEPQSGRFMKVFTDQPGLQFYCGNFLDGSNKGKGGVQYQYRTGLCLEVQHFPDSPNKPEFPPVTLLPGERYTQKTIYQFSAK